MIQQSTRFPLAAVPAAVTERLNLPTSGMTGDETVRRGRAVDDLLARSRLAFNTFYLPMLCRYRLYDRSGAVVYTSPRVRLGPALPPVELLCRSVMRSFSLCAWITYSPWHLTVDTSAMVPRRLLHRVVRADILLSPDHPVRARRKEFTVRSETFEPVAAPLLLPVKSDSARRRKRLKRLARTLRRCALRLTHSRKLCKFAPDMHKLRPASSLETLVRASIARHSLFERGDKLIVALSGGADSVALLAVLVRLGYDCVAAHCNFHLRGEESMRDMRHAEAVCSKLGVDLIVKDFDVGLHRSSGGRSVEMVCRDLRYEWFSTLMSELHASAVAVGHHSEDNVETVLLNLLRGTGIDGLCGIRPRRDFVVRPMLSATRYDIEHYLRLQGLDFIVDSSNFSDAHLRNRLRNHVIPELQRNFPDASKSILLTASNLASAARIYHRAIDACRERFVDADRHIDLTALIDNLGNDAPTVLFELLRDMGVTPSQCADIIASASRSGLRFETPAGYVVELDRGVLTPSRSDDIHGDEIYDFDPGRGIVSPVELSVSRHSVEYFSPTRDPDTLYLDSSALDPVHRWQLRRWRTGDRIRPFGMSGSRLVSDIFSDARLSAAQKRAAWILTCDDRVVWVVGMRASSDFVIGPHTRQFLKITYKHNDHEHN